MQFNKPHFAVEVETEQLIEHNVVLLREKRVDQLSAVHARGAKVLSAQNYLLLIGNLKLDRYYVRS